MKVNVVYLGMLCEAVGKSHERVAVKSLSTVKELVNSLSTAHPEMKSMKYTVAVNKEIVPENWMLHRNDEVALLPPFAGG